MLRKTIMGLVIVGLLAPVASAQTVDELLAKYVAAKGGLEKLKAVKSQRATGKMVLGPGMEAPLVMTAKRPRSVRMEFTFQGMTGIQAYDGKTAWMSMPFMGKKEPEVMPPDQAKDFEEEADFDGPLMDYKEKGHAVELIGKEQVEGADAYKLKVTLKSGDVRNYYLDAETYLEIKTESKRTIRGTEVEGESYYGDYKEVDGLMIAHSIENGAKGMPQRQKLTIEKVELNPQVADDLFTMPATAADSVKVAAAADSAKAKPAAGAKGGTKTTEATSKKK